MYVPSPPSFPPANTLPLDTHWPLGGYRGLDHLVLFSRVVVTRLKTLTERECDCK